MTLGQLHLPTEQPCEVIFYGFWYSMLVTGGSLLFLRETWHNDIHAD